MNKLCLRLRLSNYQIVLNLLMANNKVKQFLKEARQFSAEERYQLMARLQTGKQRDVERLLNLLDEDPRLEAAFRKVVEKRQKISPPSGKRSFLLLRSKEIAREHPEYSKAEVTKICLQEWRLW
jgi:hypothetical protein